MHDSAQIAAARGARRSPCALAAMTALVILVSAVPPAFAQTVATVNGEAITSADLEQAAGQTLATLEEQAYRLKQQKLDQLIGDRILAQEAARRHVTVDALVASDITAKVTPNTPEEIHALYELNRNQLPGPEQQYGEQLDAFLRGQKTALRRQEFIQTLQPAANVKVLLTAPAPFRARVEGAGPSRGPAEARVTIVEFEDFQCPFCKQVQETLEKVLARFNDSVRFVHRDFPLDTLHPAAWKAHEAARCADRQGKFWEYRTLLYAKAPAAAPDQLRAYATETGLNVDAFTTCLGAADLKSGVQADVAEGTRLGITGTPAFFINGRLLSGSQPEAEFTRIIEEELKPPPNAQR
jgi:protein-disulfide isomerase